MQDQLSLEWEYERAVEGSEGSELAQSEMIAPLQEIVQELYGIAQMGIMERVEAQADTLEHSDSRYAGFTHQVKHFAQAFEDEKLLHFLGKCMTDFMK